MRCPCGYLGDPRRQCKCGPVLIERYVSKISGPLLDRIDLHVEVPAVPFQELSAPREGQSSGEMRRQVLQAREAQHRRFGRDGHRLNGRMTSRQIRQFAQLDDEGKAILKAAVEGLGLSARAHDRVLRVARTVADLAGDEHVRAPHLTEALNYRILDRKLWVK